MVDTGADLLQGNLQYENGCMAQNIIRLNIKTPLTAEIAGIKE
jgi:hypothetical protein